MRCAKCGGLLIDRYDTATLAWERVCLNCGYLPDLVCRRPDGGLRDERLMCVRCKVQPRCQVNDGYGRIHQDIEVRFCVACRIESIQKGRLAQVKRRRLVKKKAGLGNVRMTRVAG